MFYSFTNTSNGRVVSKGTAKVGQSEVNFKIGLPYCEELKTEF
jgi:hypothetical protein